jgi:branched-subunit amino acid transport protein
VPDVAPKRGVVAGVQLALGTYGLRPGGVLLSDRLRLSPTMARILPLAAVALLAALAGTAALTDAGHVASVARPAGVLAGVVAAWRRPPFVAVVVIAAATAAGLRLLGVP